MRGTVGIRCDVGMLCGCVAEVHSCTLTAPAGLCVPEGQETQPTDLNPYVPASHVFSVSCTTCSASFDKLTD